MSILIENVLHDGDRTNIYVEGNKISDIGPKAEADQTIDGSNHAVLPGLINTHTHAAMTLFRGYADDMLLQDWLRDKIWPLESKFVPEDIYWGTKLACLEMIKSGTTCFNDMYFHIDQQAKAVEESGIRGVLSEGFVDFFQPDLSEELFKQSMNLVKKVRSMGCDRITPALGPHAIYTVTESSLLRFKEISDEEGLLIHFHLSETEEEVENCRETHGKSPVGYLKDIGFLGSNLIAAHSVWLDDGEIRMLADAGAKVSHNPVSNMKLAVGGALPYKEMHQAGINVSLGTDGTASNNSLDMFESMKFAALLQKFRTNDPTVLPAGEVLGMATANGAQALGIDAGVIEIGKLADLILVDLRSPAFNPNHNLVSNLVYSANGSCVDTVICDGKVLMRDGHVEGEERIMEGAANAAKDLVRRGQE
jgi:5-methylthioadenosine/S-adenosylhomocysteine deaminase